MTVKPKPEQLALQQEVDHIAKYLPEDERAEYYRIMMYCRDLPDNDEMLRVIKVLKILTLLMVEVPGKVVTERERFERLFIESIASLSRVASSSREQQRELDSRIALLPKAILEDINPAKFAAKINESLQQQFVQSTLPQTALALSSVAGDMRQTTAQFKKAADDLGGTYRGAVANAERSTKEISTAITEAANVARVEARNLTTVFRREYRWSVLVLTCFGLLLGLFLGILLQRWVIDPPVPQVMWVVSPAHQAVDQRSPMTKRKARQ